MKENESKSLTEKQEAEIQDQILKILCTEGSPQPIDNLNEALKINRLIISNLVEDARPHLMYQPKKGNEGSLDYLPNRVSVTKEGEYLYHHGGGFIGFYNQRQIYKRKEKWTQIFNIIHAFMLIIFTALAAWGSINTKLYDQKEYRLESKIDSLESQSSKLHTDVGKMSKQLKAIPDSILQLYQEIK